MDLISRYQSELRDRGYREDPAQALAVEKLARLSTQLLQPRKSDLFSRMKRAVGAADPVRPVQGLYMWGGVGRGKTWLMDMFFECLPLEQKMRSHFHRFMSLVHDQLGSLERESDPLEIVAERLAGRTRVVCFDEFFVSDITDAMLLGTLLDGLFRRGVTLVATSNVPPDGLYRDGLQRARFLPAIEMLKEHTEVFHLDSDVDYRLRVLTQAPLYHTPANAAANTALTGYFQRLAGDKSQPGGALQIGSRSIPTLRRADGVIWFEFEAICDGPRSQLDYIEVAREFHTVLVSHVPVFTPVIEDQARRFIALVDEFYDRNVKLILSADESIENLYAGNRLGFEFERTRSRLIEMQSETYLGQPHLS